jgi:hypothetical protein
MNSTIFNLEACRTHMIACIRILAGLTFSFPTVSELSVLAAERTRKVGGCCGHAHSSTLCERLYVLGSGQFSLSATLVYFTLITLP